MGVKSIVKEVIRALKRHPWLFARVKAVKALLEKCPLASSLYVVLLDALSRLMPSWVGLRARLAHYYASIGERDKSVKIARELIRGEVQTHELLLSMHPIFHLQGYVKEARAVSERAERLRLDDIQRQQFDRLNLRLFSSTGFRNIGHLGLIDMIIKAEMLGILPKRQNVVLDDGEFGNSAYLRVLCQHLEIIDNPRTIRELRPFAEILSESFTFLATDGKVHNLASFGRRVQMEWEAQKRGPLLTLPDWIEERGRAKLKEWGVPAGAWFVGMHVREGRDRSRDARNCDPLTYLPAVDEVIAQGGWVVRMGDRTMTPLPMRRGLVDYIFRPRDEDWMDVFLWARGRFFIAVCSGPSVIPLTFGRPVAVTNWAPLGICQWGGQDVLLPKQMRFKESGRWLPLAERMAPRFGYQESLEALKTDGVEVIANPPEEIVELVREMIERDEGRATYDSDDERCQAWFDKLSARNDLYPLKLARVFMRKYPDVF